MDEILKDKFFWTQEKVRDKHEEDEEKENAEQYFSIDPETVTTDVLSPEEDVGLSDKTVKPEEVDALESIENKVVGLYFAADWCIPCKEFTSLLKKTYEEIRERSLPFEIIFISFDKKMEDMKTFFKEAQGDWLAVPFRDPLVDTLRSKYNIKAIPKLVVIRENGTVITEKGRKDIQDKGIICFRGWLQKANLSTASSTEQTSNDKNKNCNKEKSTEKEKSVSFMETVSSFN